MTVTHLVLFQFKPDTSPDKVEELIQRMLSLKDKCVSPTTGEPYIQTCVGGRDNSVQGIQNGFTHVFSVTFETIEDRDYYALKDPVHLEFVNWSDSVLQQVQAVDFVENEFSSSTI